MNLKDAIHQAERQVKRAAHLGSEKVRDLATRTSVSEERVNSSPKVRTGIVSVNGRDVGEMRCTGGRSNSQH
jgi:hypothetical protein